MWMCADVHAPARQKKERAGEFCRPFPDFAVSISLAHLSGGRCDDYRGCSVRKRMDPKPFETVDF